MINRIITKNETTGNYHIVTTKFDVVTMDPKEYSTLKEAEVALAWLEYVYDEEYSK
jgi:hypothetical protein